MHPQFQPLTPQWFKRAYNYTGSIGDFRYRYFHDNEETLHVSVYSKVCFELADDVVSRDFHWTEEGVRELQTWIQGKYEAFAAKNK